MDLRVWVISSVIHLLLLAPPKKLTHNIDDCVQAEEHGKGTDTPLWQFQTLLVLQTGTQSGTLPTDIVLTSIPPTSLATCCLSLLILSDVFTRHGGKVLVARQISLLAKVTFLLDYHFTICHF